MELAGISDWFGGLFYYFRLEDQVPETHLLRLIERHISFAFVREGQTLQESIQGKPLKIANLLDLGIQIADALDAAHSKGIIHRVLTFRLEREL
jgi:hypothetical protein